MKKLASMNIKRNLFLLIKDYLTGGPQGVNDDDYQFEIQLVSC